MDDALTLELSARQAEREAELRRANAEPFPGSLAEAFDPVAKRVGNFTVRPVVPFDHQILRALKSPLYLQMLELGKPEGERAETAFSDDDEWDMLYQFTRPARDLVSVIAKGPEFFRATARETMGFDSDITLLGKEILLRMIVLEVGSSYQTIVGTAKRPGDSGATVNFHRPPTDSTTASAGGSPTSPG